MLGFSSASLFPARRLKEVIQAGTRRIDNPTRRRPQEAGIVKGWEDRLALAKTRTTVLTKRYTLWDRILISFPKDGALQ